MELLSLTESRERRYLLAKKSVRYDDNRVAVEVDYIDEKRLEELAAPKREKYVLAFVVVVSLIVLAFLGVAIASSEINETVIEQRRFASLAHHNHSMAAATATTAQPTAGPTAAPMIALRPSFSPTLPATTLAPQPASPTAEGTSAPSHRSHHHSRSPSASLSPHSHRKTHKPTQ